jgi:hypothetical protein
MIAFLITAGNILFAFAYGFITVLAIATAYVNREDIARHFARKAIRAAVRFERGTRARRGFFRAVHKLNRYADRVARAERAA